MLAAFYWSRLGGGLQIRGMARNAPSLKIRQDAAGYDLPVSQCRSMGNIESCREGSVSGVDSLKHRLQSLEETIQSIEVRPKFRQRYCT